MIAEELERACELAKLAAIRSWYAAIPAALAAGIGLGHRPLGDGVMVHAGADVLMFNRVLGLGMTETATDDLIDEAIAHFTATGARRFMVQVAPGASPPLVGWLEARGFYRHNHWIRLARDLAPCPMPATDLRVGRIGSEHADAFGRLAAEAFGHPPSLAGLSACLVGRAGWSFFGAFDGDALVGCSALHVQGPAARFGFASTRPGYRGRGAQSALIAARIEAARQAGCRWACVETLPDTPGKPNPSTHNLRRLGFRDAYERPNWVKVLRAV